MERFGQRQEAKSSKASQQSAFNPARASADRQRGREVNPTQTATDAKMETGGGAHDRRTS